MEEMDADQIQNLNEEMKPGLGQLDEDDSEPELSPEMIQKKLYFLVDQLKRLHAQLPVAYQVRIPYELITELGNVLLDGSIFKIVQNLLDIQNVTEFQLKSVRDQIEMENNLENQEWMTKISDEEELEHLLALLKIKHMKKLRETDMKIINVLDDKRKEQQLTMQNAGVPGFFETEDEKEIRIQMFLFDFILFLSKTKFDSNKQNWFLQE